MKTVEGATAKLQLEDDLKAADSNGDGSVNSTTNFNSTNCYTRLHFYIDP